MQYSLITSVGPIYNQYNISFTTTHTLLLQLTPYLLRFCDKLFQNVVFQTTVIHYLENKVGVVDFANAQGMVMF